MNVSFLFFFLFSRPFPSIFNYKRNNASFCYQCWHWIKFVFLLPAFTVSTQADGKYQAGGSSEAAGNRTPTPSSHCIQSCSLSGSLFAQDSHPGCFPPNDPKTNDPDEPYISLMSIGNFFSVFKPGCPPVIIHSVHPNDLQVKLY